MAKLFIVGNGFDLAHGMKTSYQHFHEYLKEEYPESDGDDFTVPEGREMPRGEVVYDDVDTVSYLLRLISNVEPEADKWSDLETSLGVLDLSEWMDSIGEQLDEDGDPDYTKNAFNIEDLVNGLVEPTRRITDYFTDWVDTIEDIEAVPSKDDFAALIDKEDDHFLTFNYTTTLEILYQAKNVCHIHGEQGGDLLVGHGNDEDYYETNMGTYTGSQEGLQKIQELLRKNTAGAMLKYKCFFEGLTSSVDSIYSFGFSFAEVDEVYIEEICKRVDTAKITWYMNDYDGPDKRAEYQELIRRCKFSGEFSTYHIA